MSICNPGSEEAKIYLDSYRSFSTTLRTWLVAYGIGAPVLFASQDAFSSLLTNKEIVFKVICLFLVGVSTQIISALLNKISMWYIMWGAMNEDFKSEKRYTLSDWYSEQLWIEIVFDILSIVVFAWSTVLVLIELIGKKSHITSS